MLEKEIGREGWGKIGKNKRKNRASHDITPLLKAFSPEGVTFEVSVAPLFPVGDARHRFGRGGVEERVDWLEVERRED